MNRAAIFLAIALLWPALDFVLGFDLRHTASQVAGAGAALVMHWGTNR